MTNDDGYVLIEPDSVASHMPEASLYLSSQPVSWSIDRIDTALHDVQAASVTGWKSVLADTYRDQLADLVQTIRQVRSLAYAAEHSYEHLRYVAALNGER